MPSIAMLHHDQECASAITLIASLSQAYISWALSDTTSLDPGLKQVTRYVLSCDHEQYAHPLGVSPRGTSSTCTGDSRRPPRRAGRALRSDSAAIAAVAAPKLRPKRESFVDAAGRVGTAEAACTVRISKCNPLPLPHGGFSCQVLAPVIGLRT